MARRDLIKNTHHGWPLTPVFTTHLSVGALKPMRGRVKSGRMEAIIIGEYEVEGFHVGSMRRFADESARLRFLTLTLTPTRWDID
jgi:hypothetical protein